MSPITRRELLKRSVGAGAAMALGWTARSYAQVAGANEDIRVAVVGFHGRGKSHIEGYRKLDGVRLVALCDPDEEVVAKQVAALAKDNVEVATYRDIRKLLEDKSIDAISIATPNHWHSLMVIWACQAGKDAYVEKPISHNVWEGRKAVEAARKYQRIVQAGTQSRSSAALKEAMEFLHGGGLGKLRWVRGLCFKPRGSIGKVDGDQPIPPSIDYDLWTGPAPLAPLHRKRLHYDWHWVWPTGNGDLGNQGIHEMDVCRWALGAKTVSPRVLSVGGRFGYDDDGETPNTQIVFHDYEPAPIIFEVRGLPFQQGEKTMSTYRGVDIGVVVECEDGYLTIGSYSSAAAFDREKNKIREFKGGGDHFANFIDAVRSRKSSDLNCDVAQGHLSSALCHMGNVSYRVGAKALPGEIREAMKDKPEAVKTFERFLAHLEKNEVDLRETPAVLGQWLKMDPKKETFIGAGAEADALLRREYRKPFVVPEKV